MNIDNVKKMIFIRFDVEQKPKDALLKSLAKHCFVENSVPFLISQPGSHITMFETKSDYNEIYNDFYDDLKHLKNGKIFILIDITNSDMRHTYPKEFSTPINNFLGKQEIEISPNNNYSLTELNHELKIARDNENYELCQQIQNQINIINTCKEEKKMKTE